MSSLGRLTNSFFSATNENTLALANFNFDFALIKFEAPQEFHGLGTSLSRFRRENAEDGPLHKTLRKLGCLFEQVLPSTPKLIKAYGLRASEIINSPGINPKGCKSHGPFEPFVGADGTSIWAAATSGPAALSVHLLACMLARQFDDSKIGIAILVELVLERQREILEEVKNNHIVSMSSIMAAQQDISREELAAFDASARSWLYSADEAKIPCQKKLMLILRNINTTVSGGSSTYVKVLEAWKQAMVGFEDLLGGMPQQVSSGAVLRALSAWHLYPDLIVLVDKTVNVKFEDPLLPIQGAVTIGLQSKEEAPDNGVQWSLTLSHLRFYGEPVTVETQGNDPRVDMKQFQMIAFGSLLGAWSVSAEGVRDAAVWFQSLWNKLELGTSKDVIVSRLPWLRAIVDIADELLASQGDNWETSRLLVNYGRRRGRKFLANPEENFRPFFGLKNSLTLATVDLNIDYGIQYLRQVAMSLELRDHEAFIMYSETNADGVYCELGTAVQHTRLSPKRWKDGSVKQEHTHARWICSGYSFPTDSNPSCSRPGVCSDNCSCRSVGLFCGRACHQAEGRECQARWLASRLQQLSSQREEFRLIKEMPIRDSREHNQPLQGEECRWYSSPALYSNDEELRCTVTTHSKSISLQSCQCFESRARLAPRFIRAAGFPEGFSLYVKVARYYTPGFKYKIKESWSGQTETTSMLQRLFSTKETSTRLFQFLENRSSTTTPRTEISTLSKILHSEPDHRAFSSLSYVQETATIPLSFIKSLRAISFANRMYDGIRAASIPSKIVEQPLYDNHWIPEDPQTQNGVLKQPSHAQAIACILTFESGGIRAMPSELESVMAVSSCNSIFIAGALLSDPTKIVKGPDIRHVTGNVGKPGITLLVSPQNPLVKPPSRDFRAATHAEYDHKRSDNFSGTSLHLSFTKWTLPLNGGEYGLIDQDIFLAEAVVSVRDCGRWIADIDVLGVRPEEYVINIACKCNHRNKFFVKACTSIDSWEELLDPPLAVGIFRAHENWAARLAAICILKQKNMVSRVVIVDHNADCLTCLESYM